MVLDCIMLLKCSYSIHLFLLQVVRFVDRITETHWCVLEKGRGRFHLLNRRGFLDLEDKTFFITQIL